MLTYRIKNCNDELPKISLFAKKNNAFISEISYTTYLSISVDMHSGTTFDNLFDILKELVPFGIEPISVGEAFNQYLIERRSQISLEVEYMNEAILNGVSTIPEEDINAMEEEYQILKIIDNLVFRLAKEHSYE
jgi:hypothetical protein